MKYKLLKNINFANKGREFEYPITIGSEGLTSIDSLISLIGIDNKDFFEEIETKSIYDLGEGDKYYYIDTCNEIQIFTLNYIRDIAYIQNLEYGNVFLTKKEAEQELEKRKAMATIKKWSYDNDGGYEFKEGTDNPIIIYDFNINMLTTAWDNEYKHISQQYYSAEYKAEQALQELEAEYKILFNIK